ncbi:MAG TPA: hypothetical protein VL137_04255 [Polyangiaceae bacterium]|nr:hypothetical protein [Polyangiaceae bacterium]
MTPIRTVILSFAISMAGAANAAKHDPVGAEQLFSEGRAALEAGDYATACKKFEESNRLEPAAGTLMNRATCEQRSGKIATAWQLWREALDQLDPSDDRVRYARAQLQALEPRIPRLTIKPAAPLSPSVAVFRDGVRLADGSLNVPLRVDPGTHLVLVRMEGHSDQRYSIDLQERQRSEILVRVGQALPGPQREPALAGKSSPTLGYVLASIGLAGIGGAVVTQVMMEKEKETIAVNCPNKRCNEQGFAAVQNGRKLLIANRILWGVGGTAFVGGVALVLFHSDSSSGEQRVGLALSPNSIGLVHQGRF